MAKTEILNIDTSNAVKSINQLKKELEEAKKNLQQFAEGSDDFKKAASNVEKLNKQLEQANREMNIVPEGVKAFQKLGSSINNVTIDFSSFSKISAGFAGSFNILNTAVKMFSSQSEESQKALSEISAMVQSLPIQFIALAEGVNMFGNALNFKLFKKIGELTSFSNITKNILNSLTSDKTTGELKFIVDLLLKAGGKQTWLNIAQTLAKLNAVSEKIEYIKKLSNGTKADADALARYQEIANSLKKDLSTLYGNASVQINEYISKQSIANKLLIAFKSVASKLGVSAGGLGAVFSIIAAGITSITVGLVKLNKSLKQVKKETEEWNSIRNITKKGLQDAANELTNIQLALYNATNKKGGLKEQQRALGRLNELVPEYAGHLNTATGAIEGNTKALNTHINELLRQAKVQAAIDKIVDLEKNRIDAEQNLQMLKDDIEKTTQEIARIQKDVYSQAGNAYSDVGVFGLASSAPDERKLKDLKKQYDEQAKLAEKYAKQIQHIIDNYDTNLAAQKSSGAGGAGSFVKGVQEEIERLKPAMIAALSQTDWIGDIPITETAQRLAQQVNNIIKLVNTDGSLTDVNIGIKVGELGDSERNKQLRQYVDYLTEAAHQMEVLTETAQRFGESSLGLTGSWQNVISDFSATFKMLGDNIEATIDKGEIGFDSWTKMAASGIASIGTLLNALSDEVDTSTEKGFEQQKTYQISATVMNTIAGVVNAWSSALSIAPPIGPILGAANSAMMIALGAIQIAKIRNTKFSQSSTASGSATAATINTPSQISNAVQSANIQSSISDSRVYVVESDIKSTSNKVSVQESENRY